MLIITFSLIVSFERLQSIDSIILNVSNESKRDLILLLVLEHIPKNSLKFTVFNQEFKQV